MSKPRGAWTRPLPEVAPPAEVASARQEVKHLIATRIEPARRLRVGGGAACDGEGTGAPADTDASRLDAGEGQGEGSGRGRDADGGCAYLPRGAL